MGGDAHLAEGAFAESFCYFVAGDLDLFVLLLHNIGIFIINMLLMVGGFLGLE